VIHCSARCCPYYCFALLDVELASSHSCAPRRPLNSCIKWVLDGVFTVFSYTTAALQLFLRLEPKRYHPRAHCICAFAQMQPSSVCCECQDHKALYRANPRGKSVFELRWQVFVPQLVGVPSHAWIWYLSRQHPVCIKPINCSSHTSRHNSSSSSTPAMLMI